MPRIPYAEKGTEAEGATVVYAQVRSRIWLCSQFTESAGTFRTRDTSHGRRLGQSLSSFVVSPPRIREMAYLTVARHNQCAYCVGHHTFFAKQAGMTDEEIALLGESGVTRHPLFERRTGRHPLCIGDH